MPVKPDLRIQPGAYVSDGTHLYQVRRINHTPSYTRLVVTDCKTDLVHQYDLAVVRRDWTLVQPAPVLQVPDRPDVAA